MIYFVKLSVYADEEGDCTLCPQRYHRNGDPKPCPFADGTFTDGTRRKACLESDITDKLALYEGAASIAISQGAKIAELKKRIAVLERAIEFVDTFDPELANQAIEKAEKELEDKDETK